MPNLANKPPETRFVALFVGKSGSGKTSAAASFPGMKKFFDFDGRIQGIQGCSWLDEEVKSKRIEYEYYPPRREDGKPNYQKINDDLEVLFIQMRQGQCPYQGLILDSMTSFTFALVADALKVTHIQGGKGKFLGTQPMAGPEDYGFEAQGTYSMMAALRSLPIQTIIVTAHYVDRYGKEDPDNPFSESVVIGKKLSLRDKIGENIQPYFDHVFQFEKRDGNQGPRHFVKFRSDLARTTYNKLPNGEVEITGKNFYQGLMTLAGIEVVKA